MTTDAKILKALRKASPSAISGSDLSDHLGISRAAIWARIQELRALGYDIEASPHRGYCLLNSPDLLHADDLISRLETPRVVGRDIQVFEQTTSTNEVIEMLARGGAAEGAVVFAESQTKGRGRLGRRWESASHCGLWFSVLLRPQLRVPACTQLTITGATALARAIRNQTGLMLEIKWPNDIMYEGKKLAGILTELSGELDFVRYVILGIGVNVNQETSDFSKDLAKTATSLLLATGQKISRPELAVSILEALDADYQRLNSGQFGSLADEWSQQCATIGRQICLRIGGRTLEGRAEALDEDGALLLRTEHGRLERIIGGDVTLEKPR
jgi:BirA family transcriptional regulator, biotin operon repressor / biotin---[acetyl-CoA-carboxylase] ligase